MIAAIWAAISLAAYLVVGGVALLVASYWLGACAGLAVCGFRQALRREK